MPQAVGKGNFMSGTIYAELKLSEKLQAQLTLVRDEVNFLKESLEREEH